jgi:pimeloyl-ACP methyl ester carboxylesterase
MSTDLETGTETGAATQEEVSVAADAGHAPGILPDRWLRRIWNDRRFAVAISATLPALWGLVSGLWTPRGPLTTGEAITAIVFSLLVGGGAGLVLRSRWAMLLAPVSFALVLEITRIGTSGPSVDAIHFSGYGMMALAVGRGFHALVALVPMVFGAAMGAALARHISGEATPPTGGHYARRAGAALTALALIALTVWLARPAGTAPILGPDGVELPGSVSELTRVDINGHDLAMMIRGHSVDNPVLLFLAGGPGGSEIGSMRNHLEALEEHFVVVTWDQRGAGKSYPQLDPASKLTPESAVADTIAVTEYLRDRFGKDKIYLVGQSWGTVLGILTVQERPDLYHAYIGTGQMVSPLETDRIIYQDTMDWARATGRDGLVDTLTSIGPPPYESILDYEPALSWEQDVYPYDHSPNSEGRGQMSENLIVGEYSLIEQVHIFAGFLDTFSTLYPQIQDIDFRASATSLDVPVHLMQGAHEADGRAALAEEWYADLEAPTKSWITFETSGHRPLFEQPDRFTDAMVDVVLATTAGGD